MANDFPDSRQERMQWHVCIFCGQAKVKNPGHYGRDCPDPSKDSMAVIPLEALEHGSYYYGWGRNGRLGRWEAKAKVF